MHMSGRFESVPPPAQDYHKNEQTMSTQCHTSASHLALQASAPAQSVERELDGASWPAAGLVSVSATCLWQRREWVVRLRETRAVLGDDVASNCVDAAGTRRAAV